MRGIFVNHCHPDCPHVCGTRAREFAHALARQGHQIVLLTESLRPGDVAPDAAGLAAALAGHGWSVPFGLAVPPSPAPVLEALRAGRLPGPVRAAVITYQYLVRGGMFTDWRDASAVYWRPLVEGFRPDVVWGVFGNTDAWAIAQGIARTAGCAWVRDIKDQWTAFIPSPFRGLLAKRYADAVASTALSRANAADIGPWFRGPITAIYSGVPADLLGVSDRGRGPAPGFTLTLVGAVYEPAALMTLVEGLRLFLEGGDRGPVELNYAGTDIDAVRAAVVPLQRRLAIHIRGQLPFSDYAALVARSHLNMYVRTAKIGWWHHKIAELLAVGRPIVCVPGEIEETRALAQHVGGRLLNAAEPAAVAAAVETVWESRGTIAGDRARLRELAWDAAAEKLILVLATAMASARR